MTDANDTTFTSPQPPRLILGSASPRRQELLRAAGYEFEIDPSDVDEDDFLPGTSPIELAAKLAKAKAQRVAARHPTDVVLAADTVVALGEEIIGKPDDAAHAREIVRLLAGATHIVITGVAVAIDSKNHLRVARALSAVRMRRLTALEFEQYLLSGLWRGKAGAYGLQDPDPIVKHIGGSRTNVIGLPMSLAGAMLADAGILPTQKTGPAPEPRTADLP